MKYYWTLIKNEWLLTLRLKESFLSVLFFCALVLICFSIILPQAEIPLVLWLVTLFGGILRMNRTFEAEEEGNVIPMLKTIPDIGLSFFVAKLTFNFVVLVLIQVLVFLMSILLLNPHDPWSIMIRYFPGFILADIGFAVLGTLFSGILADQKRHDLMLPVIVYPLLFPLIIAVVKSAEATEWIKILFAFDVLYLVGSLMVWPFIWRA